MKITEQDGAMLEGFALRMNDLNYVEECWALRGVIDRLLPEEEVCEADAGEYADDYLNGSRLDLGTLQTIIGLARVQDKTEVVLFLEDITAVSFINRITKQRRQ